MKKMNAHKVYLIYVGFTAFLFELMFNVSSIYRIEVAALNPLQLVLVGTVLEASCFLFEIPTGIIADLKSRKLSVMIGLILIGVGFFIEGAFPVFYVILISQFLWGVGYTFLSGADEAWIADELQGKNLDETYLRAAQVGQFFSIAAIALSTLLGTIQLKLPILISGISFILLAVFLMMYMPEDHFHRAEREERSTFGKMFALFKEGIRSIKKNSMLVTLLLISLFYGLYSEGFDRLWTAHFLKDITFNRYPGTKPVVWFGIINIGSMLVSMGFVEIVKAKIKKGKAVSKVWILLSINIGMVISMILFGLSGNLSLAISTYLVFFVLRRVNEPIFRAWLNSNIDSKVRATVLSTFGQVDALGQIVGGPIIGLIALQSSIPTAIVISALILAPVILCYGIYLKNQKRRS